MFTGTGRYFNDHLIGIEAAIFHMRFEHILIAGKCLGLANDLIPLFSGLIKDTSSKCRFTVSWFMATTSCGNAPTMVDNG